MTFSHLDPEGRGVMVDVSGMVPTLRTAVAAATVRMSPETLRAASEAKATKGDVFGVARLAGIVAAKKTPDITPLAHQMALRSESIEFHTDMESGTIRFDSTVRACKRTGV